MFLQYLKKNMPSHEKKRFLSLVWKAVITVGLATFVASSAIIVLGKFNLDTNYDLERSRIRHVYRKAFTGILNRIKNDRVDLGWYIPVFLSESFSKDNALSTIKKQLDDKWYRIELESEIESAFLFNREGDLIGEWGNTLYQNQFNEWLKYVQIKEEPFDKILCEENCIHYHAAPFLHQNDFTGIFIFGIDLRDVVVEMSTITDSYVSILSLSDRINNKTNPHINAWSSNVIALTRRRKNLRLLQEFSKRYPNALDKKNNRIFLEDKFYELIPLSFNETNQTRLVIIEDISQGLQDLRKAAALYVVNGLLSLIISGGILLLLLIKPMRKLKHIITLLPLIAHKQYDQVSRQIVKPVQGWLYKDEIDILESASHEFIQTLQKLDNEVSRRTERLAAQALELQKEKNFIDNILDTAQVIIFTIDRGGLISSVNKYTEYLTEYQELELLGRPFDYLIQNEASSQALQSSIAQLLNTDKKTFQFECSIYSLNGSQLYISWYLTLLAFENNHDEMHSEILVVGLDLTERKKTEKQLTWLAEHDPLTGLYNRRKFEKELDKSIVMSKRYFHSSALIFFDIDQFKYVNDSSGHQIGDAMLVKVAERLKVATRMTDVVARFGGDEFIIIAPKITQRNAEVLVDKICSEMSSVIISAGNEQHRVSISAGLLMFPAQNCSAQDLLATVDVAMYRAKDGGRGGWRLANTEDINRHEIKTRVNWKNRIEKALDENKFILYYQPIMSIADQSVSHYECLLRMLDEADHIIPPGMFIEVAEQTGLIFQLDQRVIELAFSQQAQLIKQGHKVSLSINLSGEMLSNPYAFAIITKLLSKYQLDAHHFIFEVTETQAVTNLQSAHDFIQKINSIGGCFALDDFGVGFSSMNYLKQLPVKYLKIDGTFVRNISNSLEDELFVNAINSVGQGMGIKTIAEFVENDDILQKLKKLGVNFAQGYAIGKPQANPEFRTQWVIESAKP